MPSGSITIAGLGIHAARHPTVEVLDCLRAADYVLHSVAGASVREWIRSLTRAEEDLNVLYRDGAPRLEAYRAMADRAVALAKDGRRVAFVVYGHPCVLHTGVQLTLRDAAREGIATKVLPGVSTIDGLLAAIGVDPGFGGLHVLEASDMLLYGRVPQRRGHVLILQVAMTGSRLHASVGHHGERVESLLRRLATLYAPHDRALHFRLQTNDNEETLRWTDIAGLRFEDWSDSSSLYLPPVREALNDGHATSSALGAKTVAMHSATLGERASSLTHFVASVAPADNRMLALVCLGVEASIVGASAAARTTGPVDVFVPSATGRLDGPVRGPVVVVMDGPTWPEWTSPLIQVIEQTCGAIAGLVFVHKPLDRTLVERLSKLGCPATALMKGTRMDGREHDERLKPIVAGELDEHGTSTVFVTSADGSLTEVPPRPWSSWPALEQLNGVRRASQLHPPAEPEIFRLADKQPESRSSDASLPRELAGRLRRTLLGGEGDVHALAVDLEASLPASKGLAVAVYVRGQQASCRVCVNTRDVNGLARTIEVVRAELKEGGRPGADNAAPVVLLSVLGQPRITSRAAVSNGGIGLGEHTLIARGRSEPAFILAHVPCFMNWTARQALSALEEKAGSQHSELWTARTWTFWIRDDGTTEECTGGLPDRRQALRSSAGLSAEINLVTRHLAAQLDPDHQIANAYYPRVDVATLDGSRARKAIALSSLLRVDDGGSVGAVDEAASALAALAEAVSQDAPADDGAAQALDESHVLLAMAMSARRREFERLVPLYAERLQGCLNTSGRVRRELPLSAAQQLYFPGVLMTALATAQSRLEAELLRESQLEGALALFRGRFGKYPAWPELWWQMRAWSAVYSFWPNPGVKDFLGAMVEWARRHQLASGAFLTWEWPTAPCFQTACVAEGVAQVYLALARDESPETSDALKRTVSRALEFCSSLVVDDRHADLWPAPSRAVGGIRSWHGGIELRSDAAGHYLHALLDHRRILAGGAGGR